MKILAIESSCDETSAAVVEDGVKVLSCEIFSQVDLHAKTGGVVPEVAAREHVLKIVPVIEKALQNAGIKIPTRSRVGARDDIGIDAIAVTRGPGLLSSLVVGFSAAQTLAMLWQKPLVPVHHVAGHIYSNWLGLPDAGEVKFPILVLTVSGGHNELVLMSGHCKFELIGQTLDDSAGEAFDKVARVLGLGYPGGPAIAKAAEEGNPETYKLPRAMLKSGDFNFSFSGLKTAVLNLAEEEHRKNGVLSERFKKNLAASFQDCVTDILTTKLLQAAKKLEVKEIHLAGGVSANLDLREKVKQKLEGVITLRYNQKILYCTDNAAMIGAAGYFYFKKYTTEYNNQWSSTPDPDDRGARARYSVSPNLSLYQNEK